MHIHKHAIFKTPTQTAMNIIQAIADFCAKSERYDYLRADSIDYTAGIRADACIIRDAASSTSPSLAFASSDGATLELVNIIPTTGKSEIGIGEYNEIHDAFIHDFKFFCRKYARKVTIATDSGLLTLESAISGLKTRRLFERFLALHPTSHHPSDIHRLDRFIHAASRFSHGRVNLHRLRRYLIEILHWTDEDAKWCCERIETGLEILSIGKRR